MEEKANIETTIGNVAMGLFMAGVFVAAPLLLLLVVTKNHLNTAEAEINQLHTDAASFGYAHYRTNGVWEWNNK